MFYFNNLYRYQSVIKKIKFFSYIITATMTIVSTINLKLWPQRNTLLLVVMSRCTYRSACSRRQTVFVKSELVKQKWQKIARYIRESRFSKFNENRIFTLDEFFKNSNYFNVEKIRNAKLLICVNELHCTFHFLSAVKIDRLILNLKILDNAIVESKEQNFFVFIRRRF